MGQYNLGIYSIEYNVITPESRVMDYDYDYQRRFISSYINELIFRDQITNAYIGRVLFSDDTLHDITKGLVAINDNLGTDNNDNSEVVLKAPLILTIKQLFCDKNFGMATLCRIDDKVYLHFLTTYPMQYSGSYISIPLSPHECARLYDILENRENMM